MGSCLSKKNEQATALNASVPVKKPEEMKKQPEEGEGPRAKKEVFLIKHRPSHEQEREACSSRGPAAVRTSSCTKEEVDAILIQCGRLSRNNSSENVGASWSTKYSGSDEDGGGETRRDRSRDRQSSRRHRSGSRRRRTPSRERRRVSLSPGRRPEFDSNNNVGNGTTNSNVMPLKLVSVPATVSSLGMDRSSNGNETTAIKRISVRRNVASPRSISPARVNSRVANETNNNQHHHQPSLSRNTSKKAEHSPYRRNPLAEINHNWIAYPQSVGNIAGSANTDHVNNKGLLQKPNAETNNRIITKEGNSIGSLDNKANFAREQLLTEEETAPANASVRPGNEFTRSRSARRSRELDINPEALLDHSPSYTTLLLEDIQNFHQKNVHIPTVLPPPCLSKARSILEAVADLNSTTSSTRSVSNIGANNLTGKKLSETKDPFVESEIQASDDLMEPSIHKYVTWRQGGTWPEDDMEKQESSVSNNHQQWANSISLWEPKSAYSTDPCTSRSDTIRDESEPRIPAVSQRGNSTESASHTKDNRRGFSGQRSDIGRGRVGSGKNLQPVPTAASAASR